MSKRFRFYCTRCEKRIDEGKPFCKSCGFPTMWAAHDEKVQWELAQWEKARDVVPAPESARPYAPIRRAAARRAAAAASPGPAPASVSRSPRRGSRPADLPVPEMPAPADKAVLIKVLRLLNAKVAELEARIADLENQAEPSQRIVEGR